MPKATQTQVVELLHGSAPDFDAADILRRAREILPNVELRDGQADGKDVLMFWHPMHVTHIKDGTLQAQTTVMPRYKAFDRGDYTEELQQSWGCPNAAELIRDMKAVSMVTELFAHWLEPQERAMLFHGVLQALVEITRPTALAFVHSQQIVSTAQYLEDCEHEPIYRNGSLNVRFFRIEDSGGEMIMDTRGLYELGLHDLQCHYRGLDPNEVSRKLRDVAGYIVQNGPIIKSGETVPGVPESEKWRCQFENSILEPKRELLDLNPGKKFAAGRRG